VARVVVGILLALAMAAAGLLGATVVGNLIASPFNDALAARVEELVTESAQPEAAAGGAIRQLASDARYAITSEVRKVVFFVVVEAALLCVNIVPGVGTLLFAALNTVFAVHFAALEYLDYPMSRRRIPFAAKWAFLRDHRWASLGLGTAVFLTFFLPGLNFACMPLAVTGATLLYREIQGSPVPSEGGGKGSGG
jgi:CysZ protein